MFAAVALAHAALLGMLLTPTTSLIVREGLDGPGRAGAEFRLEVALIEIEQALPRITEPQPILEPPRLVLQDVAMPALALDASEPTAEDKLRGLYLGQVRARIGRVWEALGAIPSPALPYCTINVTQDTRGQVLEVAITDCIVDDVVRAQLSRAVRAASPLPAPPAGLTLQPQVEFRLNVGR